MADTNTPSDATNDLCTDATMQIEAMCYALRNAAVAPDTDELPYLVQGISQRVIDINAALMNLFSGVEDDALESLRYAVHGVNAGAPA